MGAHRIRIIGGAWRSRRLRFPDSGDLRPTPDRIRETLFNWLNQRLDGLACLDLFAGSGALGFEAASRGARAVTMVERDPLAFRALQENSRLLGAAHVELLRADALAFLQSDARRFDVVFLDPPYRLKLLPVLLQRLPAHLEQGAKVYLEAQRLPDMPQGYEVLRRARAGAVQCALVQWRPHESAL
ncbi:MAG TPA: 16S rRNA (guanine(966)-N(2))-methyltransferase RsmD [Burkholderiales bacterium]|nr:16S rRNA (guanine(966)-N(2))-methyltransferase RsmD [Burkholderiales bacterium]